MVRKEGGQALLLVLIILAIGTLMIVPALRLTQTSLQSIQIITRHNKGLYVAGAAQEMIMWMLYYDALTDNMTLDGDSVSFTVDVCDAVVNATVTMRAVEGQGAIILAGDDVIRPTKTVISANVTNGSNRTYTYYIRLEQLSDNTSQGLEAVYDILPKGFGPDVTYILGSSYLRVDGGSWEDFEDPLVEDTGYGGQVRLRWPNPEIYPFSDNFTTDLVFKGIRDFNVRQVKEIRFEVSGSLTDSSIHVNWVVLDPWDSLSGPQAHITVGDPSNPDDWGTYGMFETGKVAEPDFILPKEVANVKYTISIINHEGKTEGIDEIIDYLPPEFFYTDNSTSGDITNSNPQLSLETLNGVERQVLRWTSSEIEPGDRSFAAGLTKELVFWVQTTKDASGSYYNEVEVRTNMPVPKIVYEIIGPTSAEDPDDRETWNTAYSWNSGTVIVPAYDSETSADGENITANFGLDPGGVTINSWVIK